MDISGVTPAGAADKAEAIYAAFAELAAASAEAAAAGGDTPVAPGQATPTLGAGSAVEHGPMTATADSDAPHPDARPDKGAETAMLQNFARPPLNLADTHRPAEHAATAPALDAGSFALPADQLINAAVIGLQVQPAYAWTTQRGTANPTPPDTPRAESPGVEAPADDGAGADEAAAEEEPETEAPPSIAPRGVVLDETDDDWSEPLTRALREALRGKAAPRALQVAAEQWKLGRCVVLACPQRGDPSGAAWAFVLWPRPGSRPGLPLALFGLRVDARLHWARIPPAIDWCHARVMKEQHPRQGRQLVALDAKGPAAVPCEVQLGPVPLRTPRWREVCVRIDAVRRLWEALGEQWSVTVVVGARPIADFGAPGAREATC